MSYILDALRKADAERDRGNVPGIHAQPSFGGAIPTSHAAPARPWLWPAVGTAVVLVAGALAWYLLAPPRGTVEATAPTPSPVTVATAPGVAAPTLAVPSPLAPAVAPLLPSAPAAPIAPRAEGSTVSRKPRPVPTLAAPAALPAPAPAPLAPASEARPAATGEKIYAVAELPDDIRRQLPNVTIGGSMYSSRPADRILIVNGQVLHEGDRIAPELTLQQVRVKAAVLNFKGYRFTVGF